MSDHEDIDITRFFDRFPKRRRNDAVEMALEEFRDAWQREIIVKTSYIGIIILKIQSSLYHFVFLVATKIIIFHLLFDILYSHTHFSI